MKPTISEFETGTFRQKALDDAAECVLRDRNATHGEPEDSLGDIAKGWSVIARCEISPAQVALMMVWLKTVRANQNPAHWDSWVDICGYGSIGAEASRASNRGKEKA